MNHTLQRALEDAAWDGDAATVAALIDHPEVDPSAHHSTALLHAAHRGHWRCVQLLLPLSDPNARNAEALWRACKHRHAKVVRLLDPVSDTSGWEEWMWNDLGIHRSFLPKAGRHRTTTTLLHGDDMAKLKTLPQCDGAGVPMSG